LLSKVLIFLGWATAVSAHEMTPAYPIVKPSHVSGVVKVDLSLFNSREEINYYEIGLYDLNWDRIPFSAVYRIIKVGYKERKNFSVYIRESDLDKAVYVCTTSKIRRQFETKTLVSSKICSRLDGMPA
tara:strand:- start:411 stop:794 length:384 start_codon:yes stop_codon:yes gene_type:complete